MISTEKLKLFLEKNNFVITEETKTEIRCLCIWHEDNQTSFSISKVTGKWICFAGCGQGKFETLIKKLNSSIDIDLKESIQDLIQSKLSNTEEDEAIDPIIKFPEAFKPIFGCSNKKVLNYISSRLKMDTIKKFNLHYCTRGYYKNRIIIPIYIKNILTSFIARSFDSSQKRYLNPLGHKHSRFLFNYDNIENGSEIILCESSFDCMSAFEKGYPNTVSLFGAKVSDKQKQLLASLKPKKIITCFHSDKAGNSEFYKLLKYLRVLAPVERILLPFDVDVNECSKEQFDKCFYSKINMSSILSYLRNKIMNRLKVLNNEID